MNKVSLNDPSLFIMQIHLWDLYLVLHVFLPDPVYVQTCHWKKKILQSTEQKLASHLVSSIVVINFD